VRIAAATISELPFGTWVKTLRRKCTRHRCQVAPMDTALMACLRPVWASEMTNCTPPRCVTDRFHEITEVAGLPPIRLHDPRHGAASLMLAAGVDMKIVSETLGHSSLGITADTYTSVYPEVAAAATEATAALVPRARSGTRDITPLSDSD
jgi:site-specific recombinase XerD